MKMEQLFFIRLNNRDCLLLHSGTRRTLRTRKQFIKKEYIPIHVLVLQYTRVISILKMICYFLYFFQNKIEKIKEHKDITIDRINL